MISEICGSTSQSQISAARGWWKCNSRHSGFRLSIRFSPKCYHHPLIFFYMTEWWRDMWSLYEKKMLSILLNEFIVCTNSDNSLLTLNLPFKVILSEVYGCFLMSGVRVLHFAKDWWEFIQIHQLPTIRAVYTGIKKPKFFSHSGFSLEVTRQLPLNTAI